MGSEEDRGHRVEEAIRLFHEAYQKQMRKEFEQAVDLYKKSIACYPTAEAHTFLGWTYSFMLAHYLSVYDNGLPSFGRRGHLHDTCLKQRQ